MRTATYQGIRSIEIASFSDPSARDADIVIDVAACGICGSDIHSYLEGAWIAKGMPMGHEFAGTVREVGREVVGISVGDRVAVNPASYCGKCNRCRDGHGNLCSDLSGVGGGFADQVLVRGAERDVNVFVLPDEVPFEAGALLEPLAVATRAVRTLQPAVDEPILVTGLGSIGQCVVQVLRSAGAKQIVGVDTSALRRKAAEAGGAHAVLDPLTDDIVPVLLERYGTTASPYRPEEGAFGAAIECAGAPVVFDQIFRLVRAAGAISLIALTAEPIKIDPNLVVQKEIRVTGSFAYDTRDMVEAFRLIKSGAFTAEPLVSHRFPLQEIGDAFDAQSRSGDSVKVMVTMP